MSDTMTQTPMTDANRFCVVVDNGWYAHEKSTDGTWCTADFAASLETKLAAMTAQRDALREAGDNMARVMGYYNTRATNQALAAWSKAKTK